MSRNEKSIVLTPSWKAFFWNYVSGIILSPFLVGLFILWKTYKKHQSISYKITDRQITVVEEHISQNIDLADIRQAKAGEKKFGVGNVTLKTQSREVMLLGLDNPELISKSIEKAIEAELERLEAEKEAKPRETNYKPGSMDRMDYLTGLWQQGLMSDEDFQAEKDKFN